MIARRDAWEFDVNGGLVVGFPGMAGLCLMNECAAYIWRQLRAGCSEEDVARELAEGFGVRLEATRADVAETVRYWKGPMDARRTWDLEEGLALHERRDVVLACRMNGTGFRIHLDTVDLETEIAPRLARLLVDDLDDAAFELRLRTEAEGVQLWGAEGAVDRAPSVPGARALLLQEIVRRVSAGREWLALLHAGAAGNEQGCVIFAGPSHAGKTTLAAALQQSGLILFGDDSVGITKEALLVPAMPFGLAVREGSWKVLEERIPAFATASVQERYGQRIRYSYPEISSASVGARAIVFSRFAPEAELEASPVNTIQALAHLTECGFWVENERASVQRFLDWVESCQLLELTYSDLDQAVGYLRRLVERED